MKKDRKNTLKHIDDRIKSIFIDQKGTLPNGFKYENYLKTPFGDIYMAKEGYIQLEKCDSIDFSEETLNMAKEQ